MTDDCPECGSPLHAGVDFGDYCIDCRICWMEGDAEGWEFR